MRSAVALLIAALLAPLQASAQSTTAYDGLLRQIVFTRIGAYGHPQGISYYSIDSTTVRLLGSDDSLRLLPPPAPNAIECPIVSPTGEAKWIGGYRISVSDEPTREAGVRRVTIELTCTTHMVSQNDRPAGYWERGVWDVARDTNGWRVLRQVARMIT